MRIPEGAKVIRDNRVTLIRVITTLKDRLVDADGGLKDKVKANLRSKEAFFAESDLVDAALRAGSAKSFVDPLKAARLVDASEIKLGQLLECCSISKEKLKQYLSGDQIEKISRTGVEPDPSLVTEFKSGVEIDFDELATSLAGHVAKLVPINRT